MGMAVASADCKVYVGEADIEQNTTMKWSLKVGRILGIDLYVHLTFLLLLGFLALGHWAVGRSVEAVTGGVLFFLALFGCVLLHEFGHALMARHYGIPTRDITLLPIGGLARLERMPDKPIQELWVALAGPAVNVVIAAALAIGLTLANAWEPVSALGLMQGGFAERLVAVNIFLVLFNLLPAFPMDGGRVLRSLLALRLEYSRATRIAASVGQGMAVLFGIAGLFGNPMLLLIALFVWIGASQEAAAAEIRSSLTGLTVRDAMLTDFKVLSPEQTLGDAVRMLLAGSQQDFPVMDRGEVAGILGHHDLFRALREQGEHAPVSSAMRRDFETLDVHALLPSALRQVNTERALVLPVTDGARLVGLVTAENVGELFMIRANLAARPGSGKPPLLRNDVPPLLSTAMLTQRATR
jgi:Zn-dependent protease/CBS domain-containing protein